MHSNVYYILSPLAPIILQHWIEFHYHVWCEFGWELSIQQPAAVVVSQSVVIESLGTNSDSQIIHQPTNQPANQPTHTNTVHGPTQRNEWDRAIHHYGRQRERETLKSWLLTLQQGRQKPKSFDDLGVTSWHTHANFIVISSHSVALWSI